MPPHPLTNFETKKYYQNESKFNGVYSGDNLITNLDEYSDIGTNWIALYAHNNYVTYFDSLKHLSVIKTSKQNFSKYKYIIQ